MAKDVAARDLDQTGHRIANLGDPKDGGDATKVDLKSMPKPAYGSGSPGTSLLAAAADHAHPATGGGGAPAGTITLSDASVQSADSDLAVIWAQAVDFTDMPGDKVRASM